MGERKGQNHYYPPDFNYKVHRNLNNYHGTHALRERAHKIKEGILVIRFEMPFNVWCRGCKNHVAMGVRYNAEKKKVGMYYTTPLYEFRMKCKLCDNYYVIRTDPKNFDYELVEGLDRQELRFDPADIDNLAPVDRTFAQQLAGDAMFKAEHVKDDKAKGEDSNAQIDRLERIQSRMRDAYTANCYLRHQFRGEKKLLNEARAADDNLKSRLSLDIALQPARGEDKTMAQRMLRLRDVKTQDQRQEEARTKIAGEGIFAASTSAAASSSPTRKAPRKSRTLKLRAVPVDLSAPPAAATSSKASVNLMIKPKERSSPTPEAAETKQEPITPRRQALLVDYASDASDEESKMAVLTSTN